MTIKTNLANHFLLAGVLCVATTTFADDEQKIALDAAPAAVKDAVTKLLGTNKLESLSKESEEGKTTFEAEFEVAGVDHSVTVSDAGKVLEEEVDVKTDDLPAAVKDALGKAQPDGKVKEASKVTADGKTSFEADVMVKDAKHEIKVSPEGTVISDKIEKEDKD